MCKALEDLGFWITHADPGLFLYNSGDDMLILAVHVDDCILTGNSPQLMDNFKHQIHECYTITDLGPIHWILGIKVTHNHSMHTISLSQSSYIDTVLSHFKMDSTNPVGCPMAPSAIFTKDQSPTEAQELDHMHKVPYREAIGSLMYLAVTTHPDITFSITTLSQFLNNPGVPHWEGVKQIMRYIIGIKSYELTYGTDQHSLIGYADVDGASQPHHHAISGYAFMLDGGAVSWSLKKQGLVTASTTEAEYVAATHAAKEAFWLRKLTGELFPAEPQLIPMYSDNEAAKNLTHNDNYHARTKHIDIQYHFICEAIDNGFVSLDHCSTNVMTADILTKAILVFKVKIHVAGLGLQDHKNTQVMHITTL